jgi:hypothetical protein
VLDVLLISGCVHEVAQLGGIGHLDLDHPALAVGLAVDLRAGSGVVGGGMWQ